MTRKTIPFVLVFTLMSLSPYSMANKAPSNWTEFIPDGQTNISVLSKAEAESAAGAVGPFGVAIVAGVYAGANHVIENENATVLGTAYVAVGGAIGGLFPGGNLVKAIISGATATSASITAREMERRGVDYSFEDRRVTGGLDLSGGF